MTSCSPLHSRSPDFRPAPISASLTCSGIETKLNVGTQLQTFPYPKISKPSKAWQKNTQTEVNTFGSPGGVQRLSLTELGMVIEDLEYILALQKCLRVLRTVSPLGSAKNLGVTRPPQIKPPIALKPLERISPNFNVTQQKDPCNLWKFRKYRTKDALVRVYIAKFGKNSLKFSVFGPHFPPLH